MRLSKSVRRWYEFPLLNLVIADSCNNRSSRCLNYIKSKWRPGQEKEQQPFLSLISSLWGCLSCLEMNKAPKTPMSKAGSRGTGGKISFTFLFFRPRLPKLWTWTKQGKFLCTPIKWIRWACSQRLLYFSPCLWFSPTKQAHDPQHRHDPHSSCC